MQDRSISTPHLGEGLTILDMEVRMTRAAFALTVIVLAGARGGAQGTPPQPAQHAANPTVSPDGRRIAFVSDRDGTGDLYVMNADGSNIRRLTSDGGHQGRAYWSADGRQLSFSQSVKDTARLMSLSSDGGAATELARFAARGGALLFGDWSRALYGVGSWTEMQLVTSRVDGSDRAQITGDRAAYWCPSVSSATRQVAVGRRDSAGMQIWMMNVDGSGAHALTHFTKAQGGPQCPAFSADGRRIAVQSEVPDPQDSKKQIGHVWVVDVSTGQPTWLAEHTAPYVDELPVWFPDGKRIAFQSDRTGRWEVWAMNADGSDVRQLTR
jgi:TolB protein